MRSSAIITAINSGGAWFGGIDGAIQNVAGNMFHAQAAANMPLTDLQTIVAEGHSNGHQGRFDNVVFVVDDLQSPLEDVVYEGLKAAHKQKYPVVSLPTIRMGVMLGAVEQTAWLGDSGVFQRALSVSARREPTRV